MKKNVYVLGAGGHAKVVIAALLENKIKISGIFDVNSKLIGKTILGVKVLGTEDNLFKLNEAKCILVNGIGSIRSLNLRKNVYNKFKQKGYSFLQVIHPDAVVHKSVKIGEGAQIMAGAVIQPDAIIGLNSIINTGSIIEHDCNIGRHVHIAPGAVLSGATKVGDETHFGVGAVSVQGLDIGNGCLIGAGSVIVKNIPNNSFAIGVPAKAKKRK